MSLVSLFVYLQWIFLFLVVWQILPLVAQPKVPSHVAHLSSDVQLMTLQHLADSLLTQVRTDPV